MDIESVSRHEDDFLELNGKITQVDGQFLNMISVVPDMNQDQLVSLFNIGITEHLRRSNHYHHEERVEVPTANRISLADLLKALDRIFLHCQTEDPVPVADMRSLSLSASLTELT